MARLAEAAPVASAISVLLGPTNTGKTHRAIERLLEHDTGVIGLPLRLLAREVYDKVSMRVGEGAVALVTGEEKRIPERARYWVCTVEAMPTELEVDFLAVDEIQLASHPSRGHVFTDRLLRARGRAETSFLGAETIAPLVERLLPAARIVRHPRLSQLRYRGRSSLAALPPRSAVVAFSMHQVYEIADAVRRHRGGAAVVLGALSPRARNAQVALYQAGEVDYLVATDAIGMGLNLDVDHVALAALRKFDGQEDRELDPAEIAQIVGRAGRYTRDGTFGTLSSVPELPPALVRALEEHRFPAARYANFRNHDLDTSSLEALIASLRVPPKASCLRLVQSADDYDALVRLSRRAEIVEAARDRDAVTLLWDVCQLPDFRKLLPDHHATLVGDIFLRLLVHGPLDDDWLRERIDSIDRIDGDIHTLTMRLSAIRTWTYVSNHAGWVQHPGMWQERTRAIEDKLSDALHSGLVQRFVDRQGKASPRSHRRARRPHQGNGMSADGDGPFAKLWKLNLKLQQKYSEAPWSSLRSSLDADASVAPPQWVDALIDADYDAFDLSPEGHVVYAGTKIARLSVGQGLLRPGVVLTAPGDVTAADKLRMTRRLNAWAVDMVVRTVGLEKNGATLSAAGRGLWYQLEQGLGTLLARRATDQIRALEASDRAVFESAGVTIGRHVVFSRDSLAPAAIARRIALCSAFLGYDARLRAPVAAAASFARWQGVSPDVHVAVGYPVIGGTALRADIIESVDRALFEASRSGPFEPPPELKDSIGCSDDAFEAILRHFGYHRVGDGRYARGRRRRKRRTRSVQR